MDSFDIDIRPEAIGEAGVIRNIPFSLSILTFAACPCAAQPAANRADDPPGKSYVDTTSGGKPRHPEIDFPQGAPLRSPAHRCGDTPSVARRRAHPGSATGNRSGFRPRMPNPASKPPFNFMIWLQTWAKRKTWPRTSLSGSNP